jgi:hypothetical protein
MRTCNQRYFERGSYWLLTSEGFDKHPESSGKAKKARFPRILAWHRDRIEKEKQTRGYWRKDKRVPVYEIKSQDGQRIKNEYQPVEMESVESANRDTKDHFV